jgi:transposase
MSSANQREGLKGEESIAEICRREGISPNIYYKWSKEFLEAGKKRLQGDTVREATSSEVTDLRKENQGDTVREATSSEVTDLRKENNQLKALVAELSLKNRGLKKSAGFLEHGLTEE